MFTGCKSNDRTAGRGVSLCVEPFNLGISSWGRGRDILLDMVASRSNFYALGYTFHQFFLKLAVVCT